MAAAGKRQKAMKTHTKLDDTVEFQKLLLQGEKAGSSHDQSHRVS